MAAHRSADATDVAIVEIRDCVRGDRRTFQDFWQLDNFDATSIRWPADRVRISVQNWVVGSDGVAKSSFTADDDTFIYDSSILVLGVKSLFFQAKGFDSSLETSQYAALVSRAQAQDHSAPLLSLTGRLGRRRFIDNCNVPEGNWGH